MNIGLMIAIGLGVVGMIFQVLSLKRLSPRGEAKRAGIERGTRRFDPSDYVVEGRRYHNVARICLGTAFVLAVVSILS